MNLVRRKYRNEEDYWRIRNFLREVFHLNGLRHWSWHVGKLDYWRWHMIDTCQISDPVEDVVQIWENEGRIAAVLHPESRGEAFQQIHPGLRTPELEEAMLDVAEEEMVHPAWNKLWAFADSQDEMRQGILMRRGFVKVTRPNAVECQHRRRIESNVEAVILPAGYSVRSLGEAAELPARSWASWRAFHPDEPDEDYEGWDWYHNIQRQPLYRRDLDLVVVAPDGTIASFCTIWYDDVTRTAIYTPVGTVPEYQQKGLGKAVMTEGLHRLQRMGAVKAFVNGFSPEANALYASVISDGVDRSEPWVKEF
jgi:mycothiol synthase